MGLVQLCFSSFVTFGPALTATASAAAGAVAVPAAVSASIDAVALFVTTEAPGTPLNLHVYAHDYPSLSSKCHARRALIYSKGGGSILRGSDPYKGEVGSISREYHGPRKPLSQRSFIERKARQIISSEEAARHKAPGSNLSASTRHPEYILLQGPSGEVGLIEGPSGKVAQDRVAEPQEGVLALGRAGSRLQERGARDQVLGKEALDLALNVLNVARARCRPVLDMRRLRNRGQHCSCSLELTKVRAPRPGRHPVRGGGGQKLDALLGHPGKQTRIGGRLTLALLGRERLVGSRKRARGRGSWSGRHGRRDSRTSGGRHGNSRGGLERLLPYLAADGTQEITACR